MIIFDTVSTMLTLTGCSCIWRSGQSMGERCLKITNT